MEEEACGEEEEEDGERREGEVTFLGEGDYLGGVSLGSGRVEWRAYDRFPAPSPEWKHVGGVYSGGQAIGDNKKTRRECGERRINETMCRLQV